MHSHVHSQVPTCSYPVSFMNQALQEPGKVALPTSPTSTETSVGSLEKNPKRQTPETREVESPEKKVLKGPGEDGDSVDGQTPTDDHGKRPAPSSEEKLSPE